MAFFNVFLIFCSLLLLWVIFVWLIIFLLYILFDILIYKFGFCFCLFLFIKSFKGRFNNIPESKLNSLFIPMTLLLDKFNIGEQYEPLIVLQVWLII